MTKQQQTDTLGNLYGFTITFLHLPQWVYTWIKTFHRLVEEYIRFVPKVASIIKLVVFYHTQMLGHAFYNYIYTTRYMKSKIESWNQNPFIEILLNIFKSS